MNLFERSQEMVVEKPLQGRIKVFFVKKMRFQLLHVCSCLWSLRKEEGEIICVSFPKKQDGPSLNVNINGKDSNN